MNNLAFLIGCETYEEKNIPDLTGVQNDLLSMSHALVEDCACHVDRVFIVPDSTSGGVIRFLVDKANEYKKEKIDNLFFYFSGHGFLSDDDKVCLILKDSMVAPIQHGILTQERVIEILHLYQVKHIILILDMCLTSMHKGIEERTINPDYFPQGTIIFYSCFPKQQSYMIPEHRKEEFGSGSIFTQCLIESLKAESNCHNVNEISEFIKAKTESINMQLGIKQKPYTVLQDTSLGYVEITSHVPFPSEMAVNLTPEEEKAVEEFSSKIDISDTVLCMRLGLGAQASVRELNSVVSQHLSDSRKDLSNLLDDIQFFLDFLIRIKKEISRSLRLYSIFPLETLLIRSRNRIQRAMALVKPKLSPFGDNLQRHQIDILKTVGMFDAFQERVTQYSKEIWMYVLAINHAMERTYSLELDSRATALKNSFLPLKTIDDELKAYNVFANNITTLMQDVIMSFNLQFNKIDLLLSSAKDLDEVLEVIHEIEDSLNKVVDYIQTGFSQKQEQ